MDRAVSNLTAWTSATSAEATVSATASPARLLGLDDRGRIEVGLRADLVTIDQKNHVLRTLVGGEIAYEISASERE